MKGAKSNTKGSALLTVVAVMTIIVVIAMGSISTSFSNMQVSKVVTDNERSYYAAENAAQISIATIKDEITKYYMKMGQSDSQSTYLYLYGNFFNHFDCDFVLIVFAGNVDVAA